MRIKVEQEGVAEGQSLGSYGSVDVRQRLIVILHHVDC